MCRVSRWSFGPISGVLGSRCRFGGKPVCLTADALCSSNFRIWVHLESSDSRVVSSETTRSLRRVAAQGWVDCQRLWCRPLGAVDSSGSELLWQRRRVIRSDAQCHRPACGALARAACSPDGVIRTLRGPVGVASVGSLRGAGESGPFGESANRSGPFGGSATRARFGGHVTRFGGSADSFGSQPPAESLRGRQWSPNSRAAFGLHERRGDPTALVCARSRKELKAQGSIGHSSVATLARCYGFGDGSKP